MVLQRRLSRRFSIKAPSDRDDRGWTPLHVAARRGDLAEVSVHFSTVLIGEGGAVRNRANDLPLHVMKFLTDDHLWKC